MDGKGQAQVLCQLLLATPAACMHVTKYSVYPSVYLEDCVDSREVDFYLRR